MSMVMVSAYGSSRSTDSQP